MSDGDRIQEHLFYRRVSPGTKTVEGERIGDHMQRSYEVIRRAEERLLGLKHDKWWTHNDPKSVGCPICDLLSAAWDLWSLSSDLDLQLDRVEKSINDPSP